MPAVRNNSVLHGITCRTLSTVLMIALALITTYSLYAKDKKKDKNAQEEQPNATYTDNRKLWESLDLSKFVWPNPPAITRIRYTGYWSGEKFVEKKQTEEVQLDGAPLRHRYRIHTQRFQAALAVGRLPMGSRSTPKTLSISPTARSGPSSLSTSKPVNIR